MITAEIIIDDRRKTKKGFPVKIRIYDSLERGKTPHKYIPLKIYQPGPSVKYDSHLKRKFLDLEKELEYCNKNNLRLEEAYNIIKNGIPLDDVENEILILELKLKALREKVKKKYEKGFIEFIEDLISERKIENKNLKAYIGLKKVLINTISPDIDFPINSITKDFLKRLELQFRERGVSSNSLKTYFSLMKTIFKESKTREELNITARSPFYKIIVYDKKPVVYEITAKDLINIKNINIDDIDDKFLKTKTKEIIKRDSEIFLFQFSIGGHDLMDVASIKWSNIKDGRLVFNRMKNKNKINPAEVNVMLSNYGLNVIAKYGNTNTERIFSFIPDPISEFTKYEQYTQSLNVISYKRIKKAANLKTGIKTKATRYVFRTLAGNLLIHDFIIMKIQGHKPQGVTFGYQGAINHEVQDKEHQKVLDLVFKK